MTRPPSGASLKCVGMGAAPSPVPAHGNYMGSPLYARSTPGVNPSRHMTWFQANEMCFASGKRLPSRNEWLLAARGTPDPTPAELGDGREGRCIIATRAVASVGTRAPTSGTIGCQSVWGAQDMIGNLREWIGDWLVAPNTSGTALPLDSAPWPTSYPHDIAHPISSIAASDGNATIRRLPTAIQMGGGFEDGEYAGLLYFNVGSAPSDFNGITGFRCVIPR